VSAPALAAWLKRNAEVRPEAPALVHDGRTSTWADLSRAGDIPAAYRDALAGRPHVPSGPWAEYPLPPGAVLVVETSGSTGTPKGVVLTHANLAAAVAASRARLGLEAGDAWLCCLPPRHIGGLSILYRCAEAGARVVLHDGFDARRVLADVVEKSVSHISLVPAMLARLIEEGGPPPSLRHALVGGAALDGRLARSALAKRWPLAVTYGMTETASQLATLPGIGADWTPGRVGRPLDGFEVGIREDGRIRVRGPAVMAGYADAEGRPGIGLDADGWFVTGDAGRLEDGELIVLGRADGALTSGGETFRPEEVERLLTRCPGIREAAVTGVPDPVWGDGVVALVVGDWTEEAVLAWCRDTIPGARRPRTVMKVDSLPLTPLGKPDRPALAALARGG
jgi:O-succinylbenzoic acid--CoA ligase